MEWKYGERKGIGRSIGGKISDVGVGSGREDTGLSNKGRITVGEVKREIGKESVEVRGKVKKKEEEAITRKCLEEREMEKRESGFEVGREPRRIF